MLLLKIISKKIDQFKEKRKDRREYRRLRRKANRESKMMHYSGRR